MSLLFSTNLPQHLNAINGRTCSIIVNALNCLKIQILLICRFTPKSGHIYYELVFFSVQVALLVYSSFKDGISEKQGRRIWANRYLMIVGCRLLVFRHPISKCRGSANFPLNVIDLTNALISQKSETVISISTHRIVGICSVFHLKYEFRFADSATVSSWLIELKGASSRGMSLVSDLVVFKTSSHN